MTDETDSTLDGAVAALRDLERELSAATDNWTTQTVARHYRPGEDGDDDHADEVLLFNAHGYGDTGPLGLANRAVFVRRSSPRAIAPATIVRAYRGKQQADAVAWFEEDAAELAPSGYVPTSQSWAPGQWGAGAFIVALLLVFILVGILVFIYMLLVKPAGTLTVTYTKMTSPERDWTPQAETTSVRESTDLPAGLEALAMLEKLGQLRDAGILTPEEFEAKKADLLARL